MADNDKAKLLAERASLLTTVEQLDPRDWDTPSLAVGWRVRDVVAHVNFNVTLGLGTTIVGMLKARGDIHRFIATHARKVGERPIAEHLEALRRVAVSEAVAPTTKPSEGGSTPSSITTTSPWPWAGMCRPMTPGSAGLPTASLKRPDSSDVPNGCVTCG